MRPKCGAAVVFTSKGAESASSASCVSAQRVALASFGTALAVGGAGALNQYLERDSDARMRRTRGRPLPAGRLSPRAALITGIALGVVGLPLVAVAANVLTAALAAIAFLSYVVAYTPLKRRTSAAILVGAVPGAIPPLMGSTAATGRIEAAGIALFTLLYCWQLPHFLAVALYAGEDYQAAGIRTLPAVAGAARTRRHIAAWAAILVPASLTLVPLGVAGTTYLVVGLVTGLLFLVWAVAGLRAVNERRWARALFIGSLVHLTALFVALASGARPW